MADDTKPEETDDKRPDRPERAVTTQHTLTMGSRTLAYTATAATVNLKDDKGVDRASVFVVSYTLDGVDDTASRPVTFCFNGGPGSSSVWLHFGVLGPSRIDLPDTVAPPPPPYRLVDNQASILDLTDLVFIDPVGTGFSRSVGKTEPGSFHSVGDDVASVGEVIWRWVSRNGRWNSPKLLAGESYGTTRAAGLALHLQQRGIVCNGLVLLSVALNFQTFMFEPGNDLPYVLYLPTYAAVAWYHDRLPERPADRDAFLDEVRTFAREEYAPALLRGSRLSDELRASLSERLHRYTGLPADEIARRDLRIEYMWFARTVLGPGDRTVGRLDARYVGRDTDPTAQSATRDPSMDAPMGAYAALANDHLRRTLGWESDDAYEVLSLDVNRTWRWANDERMGYPNVTNDLRNALLANPHLQVLVANGLYDLATPFFAAEYTADHLRVPEAATNVQLTYYDAGHMMYFHPPSLAQLRDDLVAFYARATGR